MSTNPEPTFVTVSKATEAILVVISTSVLPVPISVVGHRSVQIMTEATVVTVKAAIIKILMVLVTTSTSVLRLIMDVRLVSLVRTLLEVSSVKVKARRTFLF